MKFSKKNSIKTYDVGTQIIRSFFWGPKQMLKLMDNKIFSVLHSQIVFIFSIVSSNIQW